MGAPAAAVYKNKSGGIIQTMQDLQPGPNSRSFLNRSLSEIEAAIQSSASAASSPAQKSLKNITSATIVETTT